MLSDDLHWNCTLAKCVQRAPDRLSCLSTGDPGTSTNPDSHPDPLLNPRESFTILADMANNLQVSTATPTRQDVVRLAGTALAAGLAAGAQIIGQVLVGVLA